MGYYVNLVEPYQLHETSDNSGFHTKEAAIVRAVEMEEQYIARLENLILDRKRQIVLIRNLINE